jgi:hypothetical protein
MKWYPVLTILLIHINHARPSMSLHHKHALGCVEISQNLTINKSTPTSNWPPHTRVRSKVPQTGYTGHQFFQNWRQNQKSG